jgi:hypothetical protein
MVLRSKSDWAAAPAYRTDLLGGFGGASTPPKPDQWDAYGDFVRCVVERYDGDATNDMPGLRRPILDYEIESEAAVEIYWQGTAEEYLRLLKLAYSQVKAANPRARLIASGIGIPDLFDDAAGAEAWGPRVAEWRSRTVQGDFIVQIAAKRRICHCEEWGVRQSNLCRGKGLLRSVRRKPCRTPLAMTLLRRDLALWAANSR